MQQSLLTAVPGTEAKEALKTVLELSMDDLKR